MYSSEQPITEYCDICKKQVISIGGHCINDDTKTYILSAEERLKTQKDLKSLLKKTHYFGNDQIPYKVYRVAIGK